MSDMKYNASKFFGRSMLFLPHHLVIHYAEQVNFSFHAFFFFLSNPLSSVVNTGIKIVNRVEIPPEMVPADAQVEITAKVFHGYNAGEAYKNIDESTLKETKGREYNYEGKEGAGGGKDGAEGSSL